MAWLNLNHDINDDMPFRSHMKGYKYYRGYRSWERTKHGIPLWSFIRYVVHSNINKSFGQAFKYFCKFVKPQYREHFLNEFQNYESSYYGKYFANYFIDSNDIIRESEQLIKRRIQQREERKKPYIRRSHDWEGGHVNKVTGTVINKQWRWYYSDKELQQGYEYKMIKGSEWKVQRGSRQDKRYYYEDKTKRRAKYKAERIARKQKQYSFKTKTEIEAKLLLEKSRRENDNKILKHGFDHKSFKGEHYHGRKNKKK